MTLPRTVAQTIQPAPDFLQRLLPPLLANLSLGRAQIAIDQVRGALADPGSGRLILITASTGDRDGLPDAAAIAIESVHRNPIGSGQDGIQATAAGGAGVPAADVATIVHAGVTEHASADGQGADQAAGLAVLIDSIRDGLELEYRRRGIRFVQWATDPLGDQSDSWQRSWCPALGFRDVATLDYLTGPTDVVFPAGSVDAPPAESESLSWDQADTSTADGLAELADLIESTYRETLDCPSLGDMRTARQTIEGYRNVGAFDAEGWLIARDPATGQPVGCLVMATHGEIRSGRGIGPSANEATVPVDDGNDPISEIVYMGVVPEARGRALGREIVRRAYQRAIQIGAPRIILAVDQINEPARRIYESLGMTEMLRETVWCRTYPWDEPR